MTTQELQLEYTFQFGLHQQIGNMKIFFSKEDTRWSTWAKAWSSQVYTRSNCWNGRCEEPPSCFSLHFDYSPFQRSRIRYPAGSYP